MGYRELFLVLFSIVLLSTLTLRINTNAVEGRELVQQLEIEHMAASVGQQFIEEAKSKKFDEAVTPTTTTLSLGDLTSYALLGPEDASFNDVDDYEAYADTVFVNGIDFEVMIEVKYVQDTAPDIPVSTQTYFKRMLVSVQSSWLPAGRTIDLRHVFTYFGVNM